MKKIFILKTLDNKPAFLSNGAKYIGHEFNTDTQEIEVMFEE